MKYVDNFLTSGHTFQKNENLKKFRFALLNSILVVTTFFTLLNYFASTFHFIQLSTIYENVMIIYSFINIIIIFALRRDLNTYVPMANIIIFISLIVFYFALFTSPTDELRLVWFFLLLYATFLLRGKQFGLILMIFILSSVFFVHIYIIDTNYSKLALFTFFNVMIIFTLFSYFFLSKIEKDALEFELLNNKLKEKVLEETEQRKEQEKMLLHQCRLASMGEMIDSIAHQWRQPLMNINAILMNMERGIEIKEEPKEYLEEKMNEIVALTTYMSQTIEDFRSLFKEEKEKVSFDITNIISHGLELFEGALKNISISLNQTTKYLYYGYSNEFLQVTMILLSNAVEVIKSRNIEDPTIEISITSNVQNIYIVFQDNAGGIDEGHIPHIFDPYFTTKERTGGTGLGLYVAKIIIEQNMHGILKVSNENKGARFEISILNV